MEAIAAIADAPLDEPVETLAVSHPTAPGLLLELTHDGGGIIMATRRLGSAWWAVVAGEG